MPDTPTSIVKTLSEVLQKATITPCSDGTTVVSFALQANSINWTALIQAIIAALPAILAIIQAFIPVPTPTPTPAALHRLPE